MKFKDLFNVNNQIEDVESLRQELRKKDKEIEILKAQLMQNQIRPHFIFNSLLAIKQLCIEDPKVAAEAVQNFAGYLRTNLEAMTSVECVPFETELECIKQYVALEKADTSQRFSVIYDIKYKDFELPLLSIQPSVENAIRHGVANMGSAGEVIIATAKEGENVIVTVSDNGNGYSSITPQQENHRSLGIKNAKERLKLLRGGDMTIAHTGRGTIVRFSIPLDNDVGK